MASFYERASQSSEFHRAKRNATSLELTPANDSPECEAAFERLVDEAYEHASAEGYEILPHRSSTRPGGPHDKIVLYFE